MKVVRAGLAWIGENLAPLVLLSLAGALLWVAVWRIWLPPAHGGAASRAVTTVDTREASHKVTTIVRSSRAAGPSRRSEPLALVLILLGTGATVIAVFHSRIGSIDLGKDGVKIELTPAEKQGAATLAARLATRGVPDSTYGRAFDRYLRAVGARRPATLSEIAGAGAVKASPAGLTSHEATLLADRIADELV